MKFLFFNRIEGVYEERDPFQGINAIFRYQEELIGVKNGSNQTFKTPDKFLKDTIQVYRNGVRQRNEDIWDYTVSESGGPGTGYDTIIFTTGIAPINNELLMTDYVKDI